MPESTLSDEHVDTSASLLQIYTRADALLGGSIIALDKINYPIRGVLRLGFGWSDYYYMTLKVTHGKSPWHKLFPSQKDEDEFFFHLGIPLDAREDTQAGNHVEDRVKLYVSKKASADHLEDPNIHHLVWWRINPLRAALEFHRRKPATDFPLTVRDLAVHLDQIPVIGFIYSANTKHILNHEEPKYHRVPFHITDADIQEYINRQNSL